MLFGRSASQSSTASVASGVGEEQKAAALLQRPPSDVQPLPVVSVPSAAAPSASVASSISARTTSSPSAAAAVSRGSGARDDAAENREERSGSNREDAWGKAVEASEQKTAAPASNRPSLFRAATTSVASTFASIPAPSPFSTPASAASAPLSAAAAGRKRKVGFGMGLAALEKSKERPSEVGGAEPHPRKDAEAAGDGTPPAPALFRSVTAPEVSAPALSPSASHRLLSVAIPSSASANAPVGSPVGPAASPSPSSPGLTGPRAIASEASPYATPSPFTSPQQPAHPARSATGTPPSLSSSLSPSPPSSPTSPTTALSELLDDEAGKAAADEEAAEAESTIPAPLLLMSKHSLLAAIQRLDEQINDGEEERDHLLDHVRELSQKVDQLRSREQRAPARKRAAESEDDDDDGGGAFEDDDERLRLEQERLAREKEAEQRRREEQYAFEHFTLADSADASLPLAFRMYASNHARAARAHRHFDRLYPPQLEQSLRASAVHSRPPPLERPSSFAAVNGVSDVALHSALQLPLYTEPSECDLYRDNLARFPAFRQRVSAVLARRKRRTYGQIQRLAAQYLQAERRWQQQEDAREAKRRSQPPLPRLSRTTAQLLGDAATLGFDHFSGAGGAHLSSAQSARDAELRKAKWQKGAVTVPPMLLDDLERRRSAFVSRNGYIEDAKEEERAFKLSNPWTEREKAVFEAKYIKHPKQFRKVRLTAERPTPTRPLTLAHATLSSPAVPSAAHHPITS